MLNRNFFNEDTHISKPVNQFLHLFPEMKCKGTKSMPIYKKNTNQQTKCEGTVSVQVFATCKEFTFIII